MNILLFSGLVVFCCIAMYFVAPHHTDLLDIIFAIALCMGLFIIALIGFFG